MVIFNTDLKSKKVTDNALKLIVITLIFFESICPILKMFYLKNEKIPPILITNGMSKSKSVLLNPTAINGRIIPFLQLSPDEIMRTNKDLCFTKQNLGRGGSVG